MVLASSIRPSSTMARASSQATTTVSSSSSSSMADRARPEVLAEEEVHPLVHHARARRTTRGSDGCGRPDSRSLPGARARRSGRATRRDRSCRRGLRAASCRRVASVLDQADVLGRRPSAPGRPPRDGATTSRSACVPSAQRHRLQGQVDLPAAEDDAARGLGSAMAISLGSRGRSAGRRSWRTAGPRCRSRIVRTGQGASRTIRSATEPSRTWLRARSGRGWR